jgi:hypothetical protein
MRALARGIISSVPALVGTGGLFLLTFVVCGIVGVKLFKGSFQGKSLSCSFPEQRKKKKKHPKF